MGLQDFRQLRMGIEFAGAAHGEPWQGSVKNSEAFAARESGLIPDPVNIGVLFEECSAKGSSRRLIPGMCRVRRRTQRQTTIATQINEHERF